LQSSSSTALTADIINLDQKTDRLSSVSEADWKSCNKSTSNEQHSALTSYSQRASEGAIFTDLLQFFISIEKRANIKSRPKCSKALCTSSVIKKCGICRLYKMSFHKFESVILVISHELFDHAP
jgi:hypothetical protein